MIQDCLLNVPPGKPTSAPHSFDQVRPELCKAAGSSRRLVSGPLPPHLGLRYPIIDHGCNSALALITLFKVLKVSFQCLQKNSRFF